MARENIRRCAPWLVGGPGRCGKTRLVLALWNNPGLLAGFPLEGLFTVFAKRRVPFFRARRALVLEEYLSRPRYVDAERAVSERPTQYFTSSLAELKAALPADVGHKIALLDWALSRFAQENGRQSWAAYDLHPEFLYESFRRHVADLKLAVMMRDPREAVCAMLFWRTYPRRGADHNQRFKHSLILWCLGVQTGRILARRRPGDVFVFDFNALVEGNPVECRRVAQHLHIEETAVRAAFDFASHFDYDADDGFLTPDGSRAHLLSAQELAEVTLLAAPYYGHEMRFGLAQPRVDPRRGFVIFARAVLRLGRIAPNLARMIADLTYYPGRHAKRLVNGVRRFCHDLLGGLRHAGGSAIGDTK